MELFIGPWMVLSYFITINKSLLWFQAISMPLHMPSKTEPREARGVAASLHIYTVEAY